MKSLSKDGITAFEWDIEGTYHVAIHFCMSHPKSRPFRTSSGFLAMASNLLASLLLVAMPGAPSSFLFLVVRPRAPSSVLAPSSDARSP